MVMTEGMIVLSWLYAGVSQRTSYITHMQLRSELGPLILGHQIPSYLVHLFSLLYMR